MASRVRMLPMVEREKVITPRVRNSPRRRARAALLGRYPSSRMASRTCRRVSSVTPGKPLETRETVWEETPARRATSAMEAPWRGRAARLLVRLVPLGSLSPSTASACPSHQPVRKNSLTPEIRTV